MRIALLRDAPYLNGEGYRSQYAREPTIAKKISLISNGTVTASVPAHNTVSTSFYSSQADPPQRHEDDQLATEPPCKRKERNIKKPDDNAMPICHR